MKKFFLVTATVLCLLALLTMTACGDGAKDNNGDATGSGTASMQEEVSSEGGLTIGGIIDDASEWGPVIGLD